MELNNLILDLQDKCPSIFTSAPAEHLSNRYQFVSTHEVLTAMAKYGFYPTSANQRGRTAYASHVVRLRHIDDIVTPKPESYDILIINSHNGTVCFQMRFGIFRLVCSNGLIIGMDLCKPVKFTHLKTYNTLIKEAIDTFRLQADKIKTVVDKMKSTNIDASTATGLALAGIKSRWGSFGNTPEKMSTIALTRANRYEDTSRTVWHVYNSIQENIIKGQSDNHVRPLRDIFKSIKVNEKLWNSAMRLTA